MEKEIPHIWERYLKYCYHENNTFTNQLNDQLNLKNFIKFMSIDKEWGMFYDWPFTEDCPDGTLSKREPRIFLESLINKEE